jgi:hypothetical protein
MHTFTFLLRPSLALALAPLLAAGCASPPQSFPSPDAASKALADAARANSDEAFEKLFGGDTADLVGSGDPVEDTNMRARFAELYDSKHGLDGAPDAGRMTLMIGPDEWPFPMPIVRDEKGQWHFDAAAGAEEIIDRRVGRNELSTIESCRAVCDAQREYAALKLDGKLAGEYARRILSTPGKHDGLFWPPAEGQPESPLGPLVAEAQAEGYTKSASGEPQPYHGYFYRVLTAQGGSAPGGAADYVVDGHMTRGFALVAWPAEYGSSGVMSFIACANGIVFQADLGEDTDKIAKAMSAYDPDERWAPCD